MENIDQSWESGIYLLGKEKYYRVKLIIYETQLLTAYSLNALKVRKEQSSL